MEEGTGAVEARAERGLDERAGRGRELFLPARHPELRAAAQPRGDGPRGHHHLVRDVDAKGADDLTPLLLVLDQLPTLNSFLPLLT